MLCRSPSARFRAAVFRLTDRLQSDCWCCMFVRIAAFGALTAAPFLMLVGWWLRGLYQC